MERRELCQQLKTVDRSLFFLVLIILSVLLSFWSVRIQRRQLADAITGDAADTAALPPVFPIKLTAGALVTAALGFFFALALDTLTDQEQQGTSAARRSARINAWASLFVLAAALLRLWDLVDSQARTAGDATLPA